MKTKSIFYISIISVLISQNVYSQWFVQYSGNSSDYYTSVFFINDSTGFVTSSVGNKGILKTTTAGSNWFFCLTGDMIETIYFVNQSTGFAGGYYLNWAEIHPFILKTTNTGSNWTAFFPAPHSHDISNINFANVNIGYATYSWGAFLKTGNCGNDWYTVNTGLNDDFQQMFFVDPDTGFAINYYQGSNGIIYKSTNGGSNWCSVLVTNLRIFKTIFFVNNTTGFVGGNKCSIMNTTNAGANWFITNTSQVSLNFNCLYFPSEDLGYIVGDGGMIYKSSNTGLIWVSQVSGIPNNLKSTYFVNDNTGWVVGNNIILKTTNGGEPLGLKPSNSKIPDKFSLSQNYPNPFNP